MILVDTGYLLALAQPRDHLHERAVRWSARIDEPLIVTEYVLLELINALSAPVDRLRAHAMVTHLLSGVEFVRASAHLWDNGLSLHRQRLDKSWSDRLHLFRSDERARNIKGSVT